MTREQRYEIWAPRGGTWTPWAKAVIFSHDQWQQPASSPAVLPNADWLRRLKNTAVVVDLPGPTSVEFGIAAAHCGFRPVPLFNAAPSPTAFDEVVDVRSILNATFDLTQELVSLNLPFDAPPVFLLDANRRGGRRVFLPGRFDNRSICFPTDFPSASFLARHGIASVIVVSLDQMVQADLSHTLRRWQEAGMKILSTTPEQDQAAPIHIAAPSQFRAFWYGWLAWFGFKRNTLGGFGGQVPMPGEEGWGGGAG
jgi:hypothetical protein